MDDMRGFMKTRSAMFSYRWRRSKICTVTLALITLLLFLVYFSQSDLNSYIFNYASVDEYYESVLEYSDSILYPQDNSGIVTSFPLVREYETASWKYGTEKARLVGFPLHRYQNITHHKSSPRIIYVATSYFWSENPHSFYYPETGRRTFERYSCPVKNCYVTKDKSKISTAHAVLFHARDVNLFSFPYYRSPEQVWILYSTEPPWLEITDFRRFNGLINWTMSYRRHSDIQMTYGFIGRRPKIKRKQYSRLKVFKEKVNKAVWYVSNCNTDSNRESYARRLRKIYPVDIFGSCGTKGCQPAESKNCYVSIEKKYKFYLSFENSICQDYVTEKLYNPLEYFVIPVTFGGANYTNILPPNSVINAMNFPSPEDLGRYLWKVSMNETLYLSYFEWKRYYRSYLHPWMCDLCAKLHGPSVPKTMNDFDSWWHENGTCRRWENGTLKPTQIQFFPQYATRNE